MITNILQNACLGDEITSCGPSARGADPVLWKLLAIGGLLYDNAHDVEFGLRGPVNWARRTVQVEATVNTVQEGC